jgi:hypothetical protein
MADLGETRWDISLFRADRFGVPTSRLFRDRGPAPQVDISAQHHDPFGAKNQRWNGSGAAATGSAQAADTRSPQYWTRDAISPFW